MSAAITSTPPIPWMNRLRLFLALTVWCSALGPLIGGAPYNWMILAIPYAYMIGGLPAVIGGGLFSLVVASLHPRVRYTRARRAVLGAACGVIGCYVAGWVTGIEGWVLMIYGVPAGAICAALFRDAWIDGHLLRERALGAVVAAPARHA